MNRRRNRSGRSRPSDRHGECVLTLPGEVGIHPASVGDALQGAAGDCNSPGATRAWFDSRVAHHLSEIVVF